MNAHPSISFVFSICWRTCLIFETDDSITFNENLMRIPIYFINLMEYNHAKRWYCPKESGCLTLPPLALPFTVVKYVWKSDLAARHSTSSLCTCTIGLWLWGIVGEGFANVSFTGEANQTNLCTQGGVSNQSCFQMQPFLGSVQEKNGICPVSSLECNVSPCLQLNCNVLHCLPAASSLLSPPGPQRTPVSVPAPATHCLDSTSNLFPTGAALLQGD